MVTDAPARVKILFLEWSIVVCVHKSNLNRRTIADTSTEPQNVGLGTSKTRLSSRPGLLGDTSEVDTERVLWESVSAIVGGVESERVISKGDTPHRLAQGAANMRKWGPFFSEQRGTEAE